MGMSPATKRIASYSSCAGKVVDVTSIVSSSPELTISEYLQSKYQTTTDCWISDFYCKFTIRWSNFTHCFPFFPLLYYSRITVSIGMLLCPPAWTILSSVHRSVAGCRNYAKDP